MSWSPEDRPSASTAIKMLEEIQKSYNGEEEQQNDLSEEEEEASENFKRISSRDAEMDQAAVEREELRRKMLNRKMELCDSDS